MRQKLLHRSLLPCVGLIVGIAIGQFSSHFVATVHAQNNTDFKKIRHTLVELDTLLLNAHDEYLRGNLTSDQLAARLAAATILKYDVMDLLPQPLPDTGFKTVYTYLRATDLNIDRAVSDAFLNDKLLSRVDTVDVLNDISRAMKYKDRLESLVPNTP